MFKSKTKILQLTVTLTACAFLLVPMILSVLAGVTANYFQGISSGSHPKVGVSCLGALCR